MQKFSIVKIFLFALSVVVMVSFGLRLIANTASASVQFSEDFESYSLSALSPQSSWNKFNNDAYVVSSPVYSGSRGMSYGAYGYVSRSVGSHSDGELEFYFNPGSYNASLSAWFAMEGGGTTVSRIICYGGVSGVTCRFYYEASSYNEVLLPNWSTWYKINWVFDIDNDISIYSINDSVLFGGNIGIVDDSNPFSSFKITHDNAISWTMYVDEITIDSEYSIPGYDEVHVYDLSDLGLEEQTVSIIDDLSLDLIGSWTADIRHVESQLCNINESCDLWVYYNELALDDIVYLIPDEQGKQVPEYAVATTTLDDTVLLRDTIDLPIQTTATTVDYCLYLDSDLDVLSCGISIQWIDDTYWDNHFDTYFDEYDIDNVCNDIATSTGTFDEFRYSIECGFRKLTYWAFTPKPQAYQKLEEAKEVLSNDFPFTYYNDIKKTIYNLTNSSSTPINITYADIISNSNLTTSTSSVLNAQMIEDTLEDTWTDYIYKAMYMLGFFFAGLYMIRRFFQIARK